MESELRVSARPELTRPVLVAAFRGWNDGAQAASLAAGYLARLWGADQVAEVDPEGFFDFQATRPQVSLVDGITRDRKSTRLNSCHRTISYAVFCLKKKRKILYRTFYKKKYKYKLKIPINLILI